MITFRLPAGSAAQWPAQHGPASRTAMPPQPWGKGCPPEHVTSSANSLFSGSDRARLVETAKIECTQRRAQTAYASSVRIAKCFRRITSRTWTSSLTFGLGITD